MWSRDCTWPPKPPRISSTCSLSKVQQPPRSPIRNLKPTTLNEPLLPYKRLVPCTDYWKYSLFSNLVPFARFFWYTVMLATYSPFAVRHFPCRWGGVHNLWAWGVASHNLWPARAGLSVITCLPLEVGHNLSTAQLITWQPPMHQRAYRRRFPWS